MVRIGGDASEASDGERRALASNPECGRTRGPPGALWRNAAVTCPKRLDGRVLTVQKAEDERWAVAEIVVQGRGNEMDEEKELSIARTRVLRPNSSL